VISCLGIYRETTNSPHRELDDTLILKSVIEEVGKLGAKTKLIAWQYMKDVNPSDWDVILPMCENPPALEYLKKWDKDSMLINPHSSIINCYRTNMIPLMQHCCDIYPETEIRQICDMPGPKPACHNGQGVWIKRGDVHNMCDHDVVYVKHWEDCQKVKDDFESRNITSAAIQQHIPGDLIKFYGVGPRKWFNWFYHKPNMAKKYPFKREDLEHSAAKVADAVKLEVYGGDAIITPNGKIYVIDINSWPSFALVRDEVKHHIAKHVFERAKTKKEVSRK
jgi:hypothetical protein